jgi:tetratricopeptide (TPR) repeat protein
LDPKNTEASALANKLKSQQISVSRQLDKVKELIKEAKFPEAQKELAVAKEFLGKYAPVVETEKLLNEKMNDYSKQTKDVADKLGKAKDLVSQGKLEEAIAAADEACKLDPKNTEASALANKLKSQKISVSRQLDKVKELIKEAKFPEAQKELAVAKEFLGKYTPVVETEKLLNEKLAEYNKKQKEAADKTVMAGKLKEEGSVLEKQGKLKEAIAKFKESLKLVPDKTIEDRITSIEGKLRDSQEKEAKEALARNLKTEGDNLMSQGKPQEALSKYRESLKTVSDPNLEKQVGNLEKQIADEKKSKPKEDASVKPATPPSRAPTEAEIKYVKGFAGKWNTTFKVMELSVEGNRVSGRYSHDNGRIDATLSADGKTMEGTWSEAPSYKPPQDAGRVIFKLSQDGNSLAGQWWYGQDGKGGDWTGTRVVETDAKKDPGAQPETVGKSDDGERSLKAVVGQWNLFTGETVGTAREKIAAYKGSLVFSVSNGKLAGKLMLHNYWEELKNVFFTNGTITFDRPIPGLVQHYQGKVMAGGRIEGTFTHKNSTQAWWAQSSEGSDTGTVKTVSPAVSVPSTQAGQTPSSSAVESVIFDNWNIGGVDNGPTQSTVFTISQSITITKITNYHWNSGRGATPGTIALRSQNGQQYGPWTASGTAGQGGVKNANWHVSPNVVLPPGTYTVIDSAPATWAQNGQSKGRGFTRVEGRGAASAPADTSSPTTPPVTTAAPRTVVAEITNRSSMNTHVFTEGENFGPANKLSPGEKRKVSVTMKSDGTIVFKAGRNGKVMATKVWQGDPKDVKRFPVVVFDDTNPLDKLTVITCLR